MVKWVGIVGYTYIGRDDAKWIIKECYNKADILRTVNDTQTRFDVGYVGGIVGVIEFKGAEIDSCYNMGKVDSTGTWTGGISGGLTRGAKIKNCYNTGNIVQQYNMRIGLVGGISCNTHNEYPYTQNLNEIINCYNLGKIEAKGRTPIVYMWRSSRRYIYRIYKA